MGKNKTIQSEERTIVLRVLHFFEEEKRRGIFIAIDKVLQRTCAATGVSLSTINRIKREEKKILQTTSPPLSIPEPIPTTTEEASTSYVPPPVVILPTPGTKRSKPHYNKFHIDDATINGLKKIISSFHKRQEVPTLSKILAAAKAEFNFPGQRESLRNILRKKLGYTFKKELDENEVANEEENTEIEETKQAVEIVCTPELPVKDILVKEEIIENTSCESMDFNEEQNPENIVCSPTLHNNKDIITSELQSVSSEEFQVPTSSVIKEKILIGACQAISNRPQKVEET